MKLGGDKAKYFQRRAVENLNRTDNKETKIIEARLVPCLGASPRISLHICVLGVGVGQAKTVYESGVNQKNGKTGIK